MYVLRRTVGTSITIGAGENQLRITLTDIDFLGACAILKVENGKEEPHRLELGPGEAADFGSYPEVSFKILRLSHATHDGTPARVVEFGIDAPSSVPIRRGEAPLTSDSPHVIK